MVGGTRGARLQRSRIRQIRTRACCGLAVVAGLLLIEPVLAQVDALKRVDALDQVVALDQASHDDGVLVTFQQGVNGYLGTVDTEIWALAGKTILNANPNASSDADNDGGESQVLMRFGGVFGEAPHQVPFRCTILSSRLVVNAFDPGTTVNLHRMLVPFDEAATWDSLIAGVSADGFEASRHKDSFTFGKISASTSGAIFDVTDTVQAWANGQPNHGWVFLNTGGNGWDFYMSEFDKLEQRPMLEIRFRSLPQQLPVGVGE